jgi:hypothetical protein
MAKKFIIDESFLSDLIAKSFGPEDIQTEEHKAEMELFDKTFMDLISKNENEKLNSLMDDFIETKKKVIDKPEPARTRIVMFEKIGNSKLNFEDMIANLTESMADTLDASFGMLIALQCYEQMTKNAEDVAKNLTISSSTPASQDVS